MPRKDSQTGETVEGTVRGLNGNYKNPDYHVDEIVDIANGGMTVMVLGSCSYMVDPVKQVLKEKGIPFHNPYRRRRGDWNPLVRNNNGNFSATDMLESFLNCGMDNPYWDINQLVSWAKHLIVGENALIYKQGKAGVKALEEAIEDRRDGLHTSREVLKQLLMPNAIQPALNRDVEWLMKNIQSKKFDALKYPIKVSEKYGKKGLSETPNITIGTIHSVKGGEADCVLLHPDISYKAQKSMRFSGESMDAQYRMFYVGMTRAREELIIMDPVRRRSRRKLYMDLW